MRVMADLAEHIGETVPLSDIAKRQEISLKYLEAIVSALSRAGLIESQRGKSGGYRLNRKPEEYTAREILEVTEGGLVPVLRLPYKGRGVQALGALPVTARMAKA